MSAARSAPVGLVSRRLAEGRLGWLTLAGFVLAASAPLTAVAGGTNGWAVTKLTSIPISYLAISVPLFFFAVGYTAMARRRPHAGAFYTHITGGLGRPVGVAAGFVALAAYCAMQVGLLGGFGAITSGVLAGFGLTVPWWVYSLAGWAIIGACGIGKVNLNGGVLGILLAVEMIMILIFDVVELAHPYHGHVSLAALNPANLFSGGTTLGLVAMVIAVASAMGFEGGPNYAEESSPKGPTRAVYCALGITAGIYTLSSWAMTVTAGTDNMVAGATKYQSNLLFHLVSPHVPGTVITAGSLLFMTSLFAAALSFHNTFARYAFSLGRDRVLPHGLSRTWRRTQSPTVASIVQTIIAGVAIIVAAVAGADPQIVLLFDATVTAGFGVLLLMTCCCVAVIVYFARHGGQNAWRGTIAPALGFAGLSVVVAVSVTHYGTLVGIPNGSTWAIVLPSLYAIPIVAGLAWSLVRRLTSHRLYQLIGSTDPFRDESAAGAAAATTDAVVL